MDTLDLIDDEKDIRPDDPISVPTEFVFNSKIIVLSGYSEIPETITKDCLAVQLNYTREQSINMIEAKIDQLCPEYPELTLEDKKNVLAFIRKNKDKIPVISFELFIHICVIYMSRVPTWEKWALAQVTNQAL